MLLNFKNGHTPNVSGPFLVKLKMPFKKNKFLVLYWNNKKETWQENKKNFKKFPSKFINGWVRIREN